MSFLTTLTRALLTRSPKPFAFTSDYDRTLDYDAAQNLGLYVHIPFCRKPCDFCPYCKQTYDRGTCDAYIDHLLREIHMMCGAHPKRQATSLYFGGGTPALAVDRIGEIIAALREYFDITEGIGVELHPDDVTIPTLEKLREAGVTKLSIGIQSFLPRFQQMLGRDAIDTERIASALEAVKFETVSMDFIFALPSQTAEELSSDLARALSLGANHVAIYPFIDFTFTESKLPVMKKSEKRKLLDAITEWCENRGLKRDSIWTFGTGSSRYSSMTRDNFLGFGCSATTLLRGQFKINTFDVGEYRKRIDSGEPATSLTIRFTERQRMVYYLFWTAYSTEVDPAAFKRFFGVPLHRVYGVELMLARLAGFVTLSGGVYKMTSKGAFYYHYYENFYTLSYIDKMWGMMRCEAFPERLIL